LCIRTGYRTNHIDEQAARRERNYWDYVHDEATREDAPHAQEIISRTRAQAEQMLLHERNSKPRDVIEDKRPIRPEMRIPWRAGT
jgi:hypothetical protein